MKLFNAFSAWRSRAQRCKHDSLQKMHVKKDEPLIVISVDPAAITIQCAFRMHCARSRLNIRSLSLGTPMSWLCRKGLIKLPSPAMLTPLKKRALVFSNAVAFWLSNSLRTAFTEWKSLCTLKLHTNAKLLSMTLLAASHFRKKIVFCFGHWLSVVKLSAQSLLSGKAASSFKEKKGLSHGFYLLFANKCNEHHYLDTDGRISLSLKKLHFSRLRSKLDSVSVSRVKSVSAGEHFDVKCLSFALRLWASCTMSVVCFTDQRFRLAWNMWRFGAAEILKEIASMDLLLPTSAKL